MEQLANAQLVAPAQTERRVGNEYVEPATDLERRLARLWQEALGVSQIGAEDDFFDLGGNSLVAVQLASRIRDAFQIELPLPTLFERSTVRALAEVVEAAVLKRVESMSEAEAEGLLAAIAPPA